MTLRRRLSSSFFFNILFSFLHLEKRRKLYALGHRQFPAGRLPRPLSRGLAYPLQHLRQVAVAGAWVHLTQDFHYGYLALSLLPAVGVAIFRRRALFKCHTAVVAGDGGTCAILSRGRFLSVALHVAAGGGGGGSCVVTKGVFLRRNATRCCRRRELHNKLQALSFTLR